MGTGIAQCAAERGLRVVLIDSHAPALEASKRRMIRDLRLVRMLGALAPGTSPAPSSAAPASVLDRIKFSDSLSAVAESNFILETIPEKITAKEQLFRALDELCPPHVCFASNTSAIPIARLAAVTRRAARVAGIHFMNPAPLKMTVELVRAPATSDETLAAAKDLLKRLDKDFVEVHDGPGFVGNRVVMLAVNEAIALTAEGKAAPGEIDRLFRSCLGHKLGPLATADLIGLDVVCDTLIVLCELIGNHYRPHPLLVEMVGRGQLGCKSGQGFFSYPP